MKKAIIFLSVALLLIKIPAIGQTDLLNQKITLSYDYIPLEDLVRVLQNTYNLNVSYSIDNITVNKIVSINAFELPVRIFLEMLCNQANLTYQIIDDHIVFREKVNAKTPPSVQSQKVLATPIKTTSVSSVSTSSKEHRAIKPIEKPIQKARELPKIDNVFRKPVQKSPANTINNFQLPLIYRPSLNLSAKKKPSFAIGLLASYDHLIMRFEERPNKDQKYRSDMNFSAGLMAILGPGEKLSLSVSFLLSTKNYFLKYNYKATDPEDPFPFPDRTKVDLYFLEFPIDLKYRFYKRGKLSLYLSAGLIAEFLIRKKENTTFLNSEEKKTAYFINDHNKLLYGGSFGVKIWYDLGKSFSVFIKPDGTYYFSSINEVTMRSNPQILRLKTGLSLRIHQ